MNREEKIEAVKSLSERFAKAKAFIFSQFRGMTVAEMTELRTKLRKEGSDLRVVKNRLAKRALAEHNLSDLGKLLEGPTALISTQSDPVLSAKILVEFAKDHERCVLRGGWVEGKSIDVRGLEQFAKLPSREVLLARAFASMCAPAANFVSVLAAVPRSLVTAINGIKEKKGTETTSA